MGLSTNLQLGGLTLRWFWHFRYWWFNVLQMHGIIGFNRNTMFWKGNSKYSHPLFWMVSIAPWEQIPTSQESTNQCWPHQIHMVRFPVSHQLCSNISHEFSSSLAAQSWVIGVKVMSVTIGRWSDTLPRAHRLTSAHYIRTKRSQGWLPLSSSGWGGVGDLSIVP